MQQESLTFPVSCEVIEIIKQVTTATNFGTEIVPECSSQAISTLVLKLLVIFDGLGIACKKK
jgi:hypothetical protein